MEPLGAEELGQRFTVRALTGAVGPTGGPQFTDTIGRLLHADEEHLVLERRDGSTTTVRRDDIVALKRLPARPRRSRRAASADAEELLRITSRGWPATHSEPLGQWECRAAAGFSRRANSVAVHGDPGLPLEEALEHIVEFAGRQAIAPLAQVIADSAWERGFLAAGWQAALPATRVHVTDLGDAPADPAVRIAVQADDDWLTHYRGTADAAVARAVLEGPARVAFLTLEEVAIARVVVTGEWAGISAVEVDPPSRHQGLARRVVTSALAWARAQGADKAYVQVTEDNATALALYRRLGFAAHHRYTYLRPPA